MTLTGTLIWEFSIACKTHNQDHDWWYVFSDNLMRVAVAGNKKDAIEWAEFYFEQASERRADLLAEKKHRRRMKLNVK